MYTGLEQGISRDSPFIGRVLPDIAIARPYAAEMLYFQHHTASRDSSISTGFNHDDRPFLKASEVSVSASPSIFQKVCPACAINVSVSASQCRCGHHFESDNSSSADDALHDEELYELYLAARVEQTRQAMVAAFEMHNADPENADKKAALELSRNVAKDVEDDLRAQREKITSLRNAGTSTLPRSNPAPAGIPALAPSLTRNAPSPARPAAPRSIAAPAPGVNGPTAAASRISGVLSALKEAKARETAAPVPSAKASAQFRQEQGARANKVMETLASETAVNCPNCTATLPANIARCACGYTFPRSSANIPSLTLCTSDFTALRNTFLKDQNGRR